MDKQYRICANISEKRDRAIETSVSIITSNPYAVLPLFAARFAACTGGNWVTFIEPYLI